MSSDDRTDPGVVDAEPGANGARHESAPDPLDELVALLTVRLQVLVTSVKTLVAVHKDRAQLVVRRRIQMAAVAALAAVVGATLVLYSTIHVVRGTALGLAELFGERLWLGSLAAGLLFLLLTGGGLLLALRRWDKSQLEKQRRKYAAMEIEQAGRIAASEVHDAD